MRPAIQLSHVIKACQLHSIPGQTKTDSRLYEGRGHHILWMKVLFWAYFIFYGCVSISGVSVLECEVPVPE